jgi:acetyl esterase/lipase
MGRIAHQGSRENLLGEHPADDLVALLSNELHVSSDTPPCFVWHTWEDEKVSAEHSLLFAAALQRRGVPFDLHIYQRGRHGIGFGDAPPFRRPHPWAADLAFWLREHGFARAEDDKGTTQ